MALADGELEGEVKDRAEKLAAADPQARQFVEALRAPALRTWLTAAVEERSRAADGIADAVMTRLPVAAAPDAGSATWVARDRSPSARADRAQRARRVAIGLSSAGLALAAAVAVVVRSAGHGESRPVASVIPPASETNVPPAVAQHESAVAGGVVVDEIDSPSREVSIFQIPAMANASTPSSIVVWIEDEPGAAR
jgi:hypothetical protein